MYAAWIYSCKFDPYPDLETNNTTAEVLFTKYSSNNIRIQYHCRTSSFCSNSVRARIRLTLTDNYKQLARDEWWI